MSHLNWRYHSEKEGREANMLIIIHNQNMKLTKMSKVSSNHNAYHQLTGHLDYWRSSGT